MRGPPPKPTALRLLNGNACGRALPENEPVTPEIDPTPPEWLDDMARGFWNEVVGIVQLMRVAQQSDRTALSLLSVCLAEARRASEMLHIEGRTMEFESGARQVSPHFSIMTKAMAQATKLMAEFGMTPASRTRVKAMVTKEGLDDFESYLSRSGTKPK